MLTLSLRDFITFLLLGLVATAILWGTKRTRSSPLPLPPGPRPLPIIGNLLDMPKNDMVTSLHELSRQYGEIVYLDVFGQPTIIIDSYDAAIAMLESRSANTSDRPRFVMAELTGLMYEFALMGYGNSWRERRRLFHSFLHQGVLAQYRPIHLHGVQRLLNKLLDEPAKFLDHGRHYIGGSIMDAVYGIEIKGENDQFVAFAEKGGRIFADVMAPGRYLVELFPILTLLPAWFPGANFKRNAEEKWKPIISALRSDAYDATVEALGRGDARPSITCSLVENTIREKGSVSAEDEEIFKDVTGLAYSAGADTAGIFLHIMPRPRLTLQYQTFAILTAFFLAMAAYPEVQCTAHAEIDEVIGPDQLPDFSHREALPYVNAVLKECTRWHTVVPLGVPHRATEDDEYNGYFIPAGAVLIANAWAMSRDPIAYPEPDRFMPERFLKDGKLDPTVRDPLKFQFGFGRRICPGMHFSQDSLFIAMASILQAFEIHTPIGADAVGPKIPTGSALSHPDPFECSILPRSEVAAENARQ
ncbi:cytochrome P450 [Ganoderma leucocontextum]|nr:cytochrome P450 [Ganoderma leucocontextum]